MTNGRIFYACQAVLVKERNTQTGDDAPTTGTYLNGVSSIGINGNFPSESLLDVGRFQRRFHFYAPQTFEVTIERVIEQTSDFFYHVDPSDYTGGKTGYENTHILNAKNIGSQGEVDSDTKALKNYDITVLYGADEVDLIDDNTEALKVVTYRNCLVTNISYSMGADPGAAVTETITLITRSADYTTSSASSFTLPSSAESGNIIKRSDFDLLSAGSNSILPTEVTTMFDLSDTLDSKKILSINNVEINVAIDYTEVSDIGRWRGTIDQGLQNLWRYVVLPVQVTCSFTGTARQAFPQDIPNTDTTTD